MTRKKIIENPEITLSENLDLANWPQVDIESLTSEKQEVYLKRKIAIESYILNTAKNKEIYEITGIHAIDIRRLVKRCLLIDQNGIIFGFRGLIPHKKIKEYSRKASSKTEKANSTIKLTGAFKQLLDTYPSLKEKIIDYYLKRKKTEVTDNVIRVKHLHKHFIDACRALGLTLNDYPFNTKNLGKRSLERYVKELNNIYFSEASKRYGEEARRHATSTGRGEQNNSMIVRPYERVQFDGHLIDAMFAIIFHTPEGDEVIDVVDRIWLLTIIDVATRVILGYYVSLNKEYNSLDVLRCIRNAIVPWEPKEFTIPGLKYSDGAGFASSVIPETQWALWDELYYDNGKANLAITVKERLKNIVGCHVNAGPVKMPERRGLLERYFGIFEENGFHRIPSTTGSNPKDTRRNNPEKQAIAYRISFSHIEELTEVLIANYNSTPHEGVNYLTPLEAMQQRIGRGMVVRQMPEEKRNEVDFLTLRVQRDVKGDVKKGNRPYIQYENVKYRSEVLSHSPGLIGQKLSLYVNTEDLRFVKAFLTDGSEFGVLTAVGKWGVTPHSLELRKQVNKLSHRKLIHFTSMDDPIEVYQRYLSSAGKSKKRERTRLANLQRKKKQSKDTKNLEKVRLTENTKQHQQNDIEYQQHKSGRKLKKTLIF